MKIVPHGVIQRSVKADQPAEAAWACRLLEALESRWPERFPDPDLLDAWVAPAVEAAGGGPDHGAGDRLREWLGRPVVAGAYARAGGVQLEGHVRRTGLPLDTLAGAVDRVPGAAGDAVAALCAADRGEDALELLRRVVEGAKAAPVR